MIRTHYRRVGTTCRAIFALTVVWLPATFASGCRIAEREAKSPLEHFREGVEVTERQVFVETVVLEVTRSSKFNQSIDLVSRNPEDPQAQAKFREALALAPMAGDKGGIFPLLIRRLKESRDVTVVATPFLLTDLGELSTVQIVERPAETEPGVIAPLPGLALSLLPAESVKPDGRLDLEVSLTYYNRRLSASIRTTPGTLYAVAEAEAEGTATNKKTRNEPRLYMLLVAYPSSHFSRLLSRA